jgi:hypothetical protein
LIDNIVELSTAFQGVDSEITPYGYSDQGLPILYLMMARQGILDKEFSTNRELEKQIKEFVQAVTVFLGLSGVEEIGFLKQLVDKIVDIKGTVEERSKKIDMVISDVAKEYLKHDRKIPLGLLYIHPFERLNAKLRVKIIDNVVKNYPEKELKDFLAFGVSKEDGVYLIERLLASTGHVSLQTLLLVPPLQEGPLLDRALFSILEKSDKEIEDMIYLGLSYSTKKFSSEYFEKYFGNDNDIVTVLKARFLEKHMEGHVWMSYLKNRMLKICLAEKWTIPPILLEDIADARTESNDKFLSAVVDGIVGYYSKNELAKLLTRFQGRPLAIRIVINRGLRAADNIF